MKQSEIEVGGIYRGKGGKVRVVCEIVPYKSYVLIPFDVYYVSVCDGRHGSMSLPNFAAWAKEKVDHGTTT